MESFVDKKLAGFRSSKSLYPYASTEIRWFFMEEKPAIKNWLLGKYPEITDFQHRTDTYYPIPGRHDLGLKFREGSYELKYRRDKGNIHRFAPKVAGIGEHWEKWAIPAEEAPQWEMAIKAGGILPFALEKKRWVLNLRAGEGKTLKFYRYDAEIENGCQLEYTELLFGHHVHHTFGLELFGGMSIEPFADFFEEMLKEQVMDSQSSYGYPRFIEKMIS